MATRARVVFVLIFLAYPFFVVGAATLGCAFGESSQYLLRLISTGGALTCLVLQGLLWAAWLSGDRIFLVGWMVILFMPLSLVVPFVWTQMSVYKLRNGGKGGSMA